MASQTTSTGCNSGWGGDRTTVARSPSNTTVPSTNTLNPTCRLYHERRSFCLLLNDNGCTFEQLTNSFSELCIVPFLQVLFTRHHDSFVFSSKPVICISF